MLVCMDATAAMRLADGAEDSPVRVLFVLQSASVGGMETVSRHLAAELARRGAVVGMVLPSAPAFDGLADQCAATGLAVIRLTTDARGGLHRLPVRLARFATLVRAWKPDVVHLQTGGATGGLGVLALARWLTSAAVVATEHDVPLPVPMIGLRTSARLRDRVRHALVAVSRRNAGLRRQRLPTPAGRYAAILNGIPVAERDPAVRLETRQRLQAALALPDDEPVIGSLVRLAEGKGLHDLLRAFALVKAAHPCRLVLVGDGPLRAELERLADELGIREQVSFAGYQSNPAPFLDLLDVFVLAVPAGTGSIALLEAMAAGVASVITFCGPEEAIIHEETGLCAPPNDPPGLAVALRRLVEDTALRTELAAAAAAHIRRHFSIRRVADDHLDVYRCVSAGEVPARLRADGPPTPRP
jgi:glycosyltransferase involved in cell wall biosynthesis